MAGEVYQEQEAKQEVILMAAARDAVNQFLALASKARLDVVGMSVEPKVIVDCFAQIYRRKSDAEMTSCFVDLGCAGTRAIIARGTHILFARSIPMGGEHLTHATATALGISQQDAKLLRFQIASDQPAPIPRQNRQEIVTAPAEAAVEGAGGFAVLDAAMAAARKDGRAETMVCRAAMETPAAEELPPVGVPAALADKAAQVHLACRETLDKLVEELDLCRRYYEATFPNRPVDRLIFVGGEARHRSLCQYIAQSMGLAAQVGDPLLRMGRLSDVGIESGIDRRQPQPNWAVAIGLSLGEPAAARQVHEAA